MTATIRVVSPESPELEDLLEAIATAARGLGVETYLVGGFVRDRLLGGAQGKDIDLVTVGVDPMPLLGGGGIGVRLASARAVRAVRDGADPGRAHGSSRASAPGPSATTPSPATRMSVPAHSRRTSGAATSP